MIKLVDMIFQHMLLSGKTDVDEAQVRFQESSDSWTS